MKSSGVSRGEAEIIALKILGFLANDHARLNRFLALSGVDLNDLGAGAQSPDFLAGILNHLLQDEPLLLTFSAEHDLDPRLPALALRALAPIDEV
ncbi:DUF3572 domain-containing protein [Taklimakanibacter lacteus]|uniref:DUF3572 domain-containing protein n=1 Tax=Taklimakanibacter lacteus TaxID=2268456 RepID=UPI000E6678ED